MGKGRKSYRRGRKRGEKGRVGERWRDRLMKEKKGGDKGRVGKRQGERFKKGKKGREVEE